jgi:hypothetical protein
LKRADDCRTTARSTLHKAFAILHAVRWTYVRVLILEAAIIAALVVFGRLFS